MSNSENLDSQVLDVGESDEYIKSKKIKFDQCLNIRNDVQYSFSVLS